MSERVLITGTSSGIGKATALLFLQKGFQVVGFDVKHPTIFDSNFQHYTVDVSDKKQFPDLGPFDYVINNAGVVDSTDEDKVIDINLLGYIYIAERYAYQPRIKSVVNVGSISARAGIEPLRYVASQGGRVSITKKMALDLGNSYKATVNTVSFGQVITELDWQYFEDTRLMDAVAEESILKKWSTAEEAAKWIYFVAVTNKSMTGQEILIDNGETSNFNYIDPDYFNEYR